MSDEERFASDIPGRCLCGVVGITVSAMKPLVDVCHCSMCQRWGGMFAGVQGDGFTVDGRENVTVYASSDWAERAFCRTCGSNLWFRFLPSDHHSFLAGLFDFTPEQAERLAIEQQIFVDEKPAWYDLAQNTPMKTGEEIVAEAKAQGFSFD